ncbi:hypothetical protein WN943_014519 [Citrus x changshan-huyou]|nr:UPF0481 protein At3g47200 [Citrus x clementina]
MVNSEHHASIEMEKLAEYLGGKLETFQPLTRECSIYRVPERKRCLHPRDYTPKMVSIGPFHYGKPELKAMEEQKERYLKCFLQRTKARLASFLEFVKQREAEVRNCYAETIHNLASDEFVTMVLVDAVFLIELFLRYYNRNLRTDEDPILGKSCLFWEIRQDFLLLENQLPLFILNDLFNLAKTAASSHCFYEEISFTTVTCYWFRDDIVGYFPMKENLLEIHISEAKHFLHLLMLCLHPSQMPDQVKLKNDDQNIPSVKELHEAGVKFKSGSSKNLIDIKFSDGILEIPFFTVYYYDTERMHGCPSYFNDYIIMMSCLVNTPKDAEFLIQNKIIGLGFSEILPSVFRSLDRDCSWDIPFKYSGVVADLQAYCQLPRHKWKANLKQNYFNTPWASISVIAAVILLLLTVTQTICSFIGS